MENGFSSPCTGYFPAGLRVLVVDDDPTWLKILEQMLRRCFYEVTTCSLARVALNMLRERKDGFDIVISDVNMPDMDGFKLLKHVGLEMDLPVIMMSVDGETSRVMKGVLHGACDYLLKPVRMKELQNIWQHVFRKKKQEGKDMEGHDSNDDIHNSRNRTEDFDNVHLLIGGEPNFAKKRKDMTNEEDDEQPTNDSSAVKKPRVVWSMDLHKKFVDAVKEIGLDKVGPKKILGMMRIPGLTRENVASHLQKYRLYLGRLQKQNELNTPFGGAMQSDFSSKYSPGSSELLSLIMIQQTDLANSGYSDDNFFLRDTIPDSHEHNLNGVVTSLPTTDAKQDFTSVADARKLNQMSQRCFYLSVGGMALDVDPVLFKPTTSNMHCESVEAPIMQFKKHHKQDLEPFLLSEEGHSHLQLPAQQHHILADSETKAASTDYQSNHDSRLGLPLECTIDSMFSAKLDSAMVNPQVLGPKSSISDSLSTKNSGLDRNCTNYLESPYRDPTLKSRLVFASMFEDLQLCSLQGYSCFENLGLNAMEFLNNNGSISPIELENHHYDKSWFGFDDEWDLMEYPILWEGLFIT